MRQASETQVQLDLRAYHLMVRVYMGGGGGGCSGTPRGGYVVGRCWEACSSWVPVPLIVLSSWLVG